MPEARWFLAHRKADADATVDAWTAAARALLQGTMPAGWVVTVTNGRDDFKARAATRGGFGSWNRDVALGIRFDGEARYHGYLVPVDDPGCWGASAVRAPTVGSATAEILALALQAGKHVYCWDCAVGLERVVAVVETRASRTEWAELRRAG